MTRERGLVAAIVFAVVLWAFVIYAVVAAVTAARAEPEPCRAGISAIYVDDRGRVQGPATKDCVR